MLKLLDIIDSKEIYSIDYLSKVKSTLEKRVDWLDEREPESSGSVYDEWSDKMDELQDIIDELDETILNYNDSDETRLQVEDIVDMIKSYQVQYGGLSRLRVS